MTLLHWFAHLSSFGRMADVIFRAAVFRAAAHEAYRRARDELSRIDDRHLKATHSRLWR